jgi:hypothetical protein
MYKITFAIGYKLNPDAAMIRAHELNAGWEKVIYTDEQIYKLDSIPEWLSKVMKPYMATNTCIEGITSIEEIIGSYLIKSSSQEEG